MITLEEQTIMTTMTMSTTMTVTKTKTMAGTTIIKYHKTIQLIIHPIMIMMSMMATPRLTIKRIINPKMRNMKMITLMNLEVMVKMRVTLNKMKKILVREEEETDKVCIEPYPALITEKDLTSLIGIEWVLMYALY